MVLRELELTDLIQLNDIGFGTHLAQESFGCLAIWAI